MLVLVLGSYCSYFYPKRIYFFPGSTPKWGFTSSLHMFPCLLKKGSEEWAPVCDRVYKGVYKVSPFFRAHIRAHVTSLRSTPCFPKCTQSPQPLNAIW